MTENALNQPWIVRMNHRMRTASFAMVFAATSLHIAGRDYSPAAWLFLAALLLIYPHVQYWRSAMAKDSAKTELTNLLIDSFLLGIFIATVKFSDWLTFSVVMGTLNNNAANKGWRGIWQSLLILLCGVLVGIVVGGFEFSPQTDWPATLFCIVGLGGYLLVLNSIAYSRNLQLRHTREKLRDSQTHLRTVLDGVQSGVITIDERGIVDSFNQSAEEIFGYTAAEVLGNNVKMLMPEPYQSTHDGYLANYLHSGARKIIGKRREVIGLRKNGTTFPMELGVDEAVFHDRKMFIGSVSDISFRKVAEAELRIAATAFDSQQAMLVTDAAGVILRVNKAFTDSTGYTAEDAIGKNPSLLKSGRHDAAFYASMWETLLRTGKWEGEIWDRRKNGEVFPKWLSISAVTGNDGVVTHYVGAHIDITKRKRAEDHLHELAFYDPLTQLPNRRLLQDRLSHTLASSARSGRRGAVLFIDLDNFKTLNDTLGHDKGDLLLQQVAQRLVTCVREGDTVARMGGDEFVVMLADLSESLDEATTQAKVVGDKVLVTLNQTYLLDGHEHLSTPSIGLTLFCGHDSSIEELLKQADQAMYKSKRAGRNSLHFYEPELD